MRKYLLGALLFFSFTTSYTQNRIIDSLEKVLLTHREDTNKVNTLLYLANIYRNQSNVAMSIKHSKEALALADKLNFIKGKGRTYREMGFANTIQDPDASLHCHQLSLQCFRLINSKRDCAFSTLYIGTYYMNRRNYGGGLVYCLDALKTIRSTK